MQIIIDGRQITVLPDETVLQAARREGIFIPSLCYQDALEAISSCRLCLVEIVEAGRSKLVASCAFKVFDGLTVKTDSERVLKIRKTLLKLMYAQAPENPIILELMERYEVKPEKSFSSKEGQCILCGLCVQACKKLGSSAISTIYRGTVKRVSTPYDRQASSCIGCASCAGFCPTKCIEVQDTIEGRSIWNKKFEWAKCERCGAIVGTAKHYRASTDSETILCKDCRKKTMADVFAETLGE
ncbi:2Fe-2S iron-sulfur cluster-binding protein [Sinanaerobacter chloroacetimidivorans]|jgi:bidirectional [NiFe] hydrogenase diaphorase subunit|uniref:Ferredoxin n=1 Tax=Sinanaerobacter chloroacetimidivorans TaxID=2818044 RepID=A0A8J7W2C8_9FIRM|nr:2Fe-2S iron-sulfur cluster-binding protein [Sinanaerobacter chloroacetimidivorans]MBR0597888.1 (2Fe-2S)-binding protein [Sinanaerobacter chloroacetimidivorans]